MQEIGRLKLHKATEVMEQTAVVVVCDSLREPASSSEIAATSRVALYRGVEESVSTGLPRHIWNDLNRTAA